MLKYILKRILLMIPVVVGVVVLVFTIIWFTPGDAVDALASDMATPEEKEQMREQLGLNDPYIVQLGRYLYQVFIKFDLGTSLVNKTSIAKDLAGRLPNSLILAVFGIVFSIIIGIPLGAYAALHQDKAGDTISMIIALIGVSTPGFWLALMLVLILSHHLGLLPAYGLGGVQYWIIPIMANCFHGVARMARQTRSSMLEVIRSDYIVMAMSKGLPNKKVIIRHMLPNAIIPLITVAGMSFGGMVGGGLIIERVFSIPGIGGYLVNAVNQRDYYAVQGGVILTSLMFCVIILLTDILMAFADPRIKARYGAKKRRKSSVN
ncbi:MAG: ABC transporter permease [Oscillospiraceae bacterium]